MKRSNTILAETFGWDVSEVSECRYQRYTSPSVYSIGDRYFSVSKTKPKHGDVGNAWVKHTDQWAAERSNTIVWVCSAS